MARFNRVPRACQGCITYIKNFLDPLRRGSKITSLRKDVVSRLNLSLLRMYPLFNALFFAFVLFTTLPAFPDTGGWAATYGGVNHDRAISIQQTSDGGYVVAGDTWSFGAGDEDFWVLKLRADGTVEWQKTYGGGKRDTAYSISQTTDGGYVVAGSTSSFGAGSCDALVLKLKADGALEWQKTYGGGDTDELYSVRQTIDEGYIVAGRTASFGVGFDDFWVLNLRVDGTVEWQKTYGGIDWDEARSVQQTGDNGYIVIGNTYSFDTKKFPDIWVLKLRADGNIEWQKAYGGNRDEGACSILQTGDGGYIVAGWTGSFGAGESDVWVLKLRADGTLEWQKTYGGGNRDDATSVQQSRDGGYLVAGGTMSLGAGAFDFWVLKLKPDGTIDWQKTYGGKDEEGACSILQTTDGGYIVAGNTFSFGAGKVDAWVLKLRPDGSIAPSCDFIKDTSISGKDSNAKVKTTYAIAIDSKANPQNSTVRHQATDAIVNLFCP